MTIEQMEQREKVEDVANVGSEIDESESEFLHVKKK